MPGCLGRSCPRPMNCSCSSWSCTRTPQGNSPGPRRASKNVQGGTYKYSRSWIHGLHRLCRDGRMRRAARKRCRTTVLPPSTVHAAGRHLESWTHTAAGVREPRHTHLHRRRVLRALRPTLPVLGLITEAEHVLRIGADRACTWTAAIGAVHRLHLRAIWIRSRLEDLTACPFVTVATSSW
jgi:hypothetical protein